MKVWWEEVCHEIQTLKTTVCGISGLYVRCDHSQSFAKFMTFDSPSVDGVSVKVTGQRNKPCALCQGTSTALLPRHTAGGTQLRGREFSP